jgi:hypothetical protein
MVSMEDLLDTDVAEFEELFVHALVMTRARMMLRGGMGNMMAYVTQSTLSSPPEARILHLIG